MDTGQFTNKFPEIADRSEVEQFETSEQARYEAFTSMGFPVKYSLPYLHNTSSFLCWAGHTNRNKVHIVWLCSISCRVGGGFANLFSAI